MNALMTNMENRPRSFWSRPEGRVGTVVTAAAAVGGTILLWRALPALVGLADNLLHLALVGTALFAFCWLAMSGDFRRLLSYLFKSLMWHLTNLFVDLDPVAVVKGYLQTLGRHLQDMSEQMALLAGHIRKLSHKVEAYDAEREKRLANVQAASRDMQKFRSAAIVDGKQAERLERAADELAALRGKLQNAYDILTRVREVAEVKYQDMSNAVAVEIDKREAYRAVGGVLKSAVKIIKGGEGKELYDMAMEKMVNDYSMEMGRLENFLVETRSMFLSLEVEDEASAARTIDMIERWEKESVGKALVMRPVATATGGGNLASLMERRLRE